MGSLYLWGRSIQEMGGDVVIGHSIYGVVVIDGRYILPILWYSCNYWMESEKYSCAIG